MAMMLQAMLTGFASGTLGAAFSLTLDRVTSYHQYHLGWIWALPLAGGLLFGLRRKLGTETPKSGLRRILWIFFSGTLSHGVGASVGREGAIVQMATTVSHWIETLSQTKKQTTTNFGTSMGLAGGFSAAVGNPIAGSCFAWEQGTLPRVGNILPVLMSALIGSMTMKILGAEPLMIPPLSEVSGIWTPLIATVTLGLAGGGIGRLFSEIKNRLARSSTWLPNPSNGSWIMVSIGGLLLMALLARDEMHLYRGLGLETISGSFAGSVSWEVPILKLILTLISLAIGFSGGEFIPLIFIGATLGNLLNQWIPLNSTLLPALGAAVVFGAAARLPITAFALSCLWSGRDIIPWALLAHGIAALVTVGAPSIYSRTYWTSKRSPER